MNWRAVSLLLAMLLVPACGPYRSGRCQAAPFAEVGDAGQISDFAQELALVGLVESIEGRIEHAFDADLYLLTITQPSEFSAVALPVANHAPDLQLFLFNEHGQGVVANDNWLLDSLPEIPAGTLDAQLPGNYLLGVSPADDDPRGLLGEIFPDVESGLSKPTGLSRSDALLGWTRDYTSVGGDYLIALTATRGLIAPAEGDFDEDGDVDGTDFLVWQRGGSPDPLSATDLASWQTNYGASLPLATSNASVPEPKSALLVLIAALCLGYYKSGRRHNFHTH